MDILSNPRKKITTKSSETHIPEEIMVQILLRLPPKSLIRFMSVSKAWNSLIDSPSFVDLHLDFIKTNPIKDRHLLLHHIGEPSEDPYIPGMGLLFGLGDVVMDIEGVPTLNWEDHFSLFTRNDEEFISSIWGPVNGVYCIMIKAEYSSDCTILLWNPGNRQVHVMPPIPPPVFPSGSVEFLEEYPEDGDDFREQYLICGYGYDPLSKDYMIILTTIYEDELDKFYHHYCFHLYSLATNSWKQLDPFEIAADTSIIVEYEDGGIQFVDDIHESFCRSWADGFYLNGACHWLLNCLQESDVGLLSFDYRDVAFQFAWLPTEIMELKGKNATLTAVDGCLAVVHAMYHETSEWVSKNFDVWVMRENCVEESWMKAYTIELTSSSLGEFVGIVGDEFFVQEDDWNGMVVSYRLGSHEPEKGRYEYCCFDDSCIHILPYQESLVSIKPHENGAKGLKVMSS